MRKATEKRIEQSIKNKRHTKESQIVSSNQVYSLHIGLNFVDSDHYAGWDGELFGCENDARCMQNLVVKANPKAKTQALLGYRAKRNDVVTNIKNYANLANSEDLVVITYSGHGGQLPDANGDETDHMDETWCLFDGQLLDDEIYNLLCAFKSGVRIVVLSDSCHSGTVIKSNLPVNKSNKTMPRFIGRETYNKHKKFYSRLQDRPIRPKFRAKCIQISGCQDNQFSQDGEINGLFTEKLLYAYNAKKGQLHYQELAKDIVRIMPPDQTPNLIRMGAVDTKFEACDLAFRG